MTVLIVKALVAAHDGIFSPFAVRAARFVTHLERQYGLLPPAPPEPHTMHYSAALEQSKRRSGNADDERMSNALARALGGKR